MYIEYKKSPAVECLPVYQYICIYAPSLHILCTVKSTFCPHTVFVCFVWISEHTAIISLYNINWLVFITETECVYCAVRAGYLNVINSPWSQSVMFYKILHFQEISGASVAVFCNECNRFVKNEPFCATSWCPYAVLCAVVASCRLPSRSYHVNLFHFITHFSACWCSYWSSARPRFGTFTPKSGQPRRRWNNAL